MDPEACLQRIIELFLSKAPDDELFAAMQDLAHWLIKRGYAPASDKLAAANNGSGIECIETRDGRYKIFAEPVGARSYVFAVHNVPVTRVLYVFKMKPSLRSQVA